MGEVKIGMPASDALKILGEYESNKKQYDSGACYYWAPKNNESGVLFMIVNGVIGREVKYLSSKD